MSEVTEVSPPRRWAVRGLDGPIRAIVDVTVEPLNEPARSRVRIEVDFEGYGIGKLLVPLVVRRQAAKEMPENMKALKERIESATQRRALVFSYPRRNALSRAVVAAQNIGFRLRRREFRTFAHPPAAMLAVLQERGLEPTFAHKGAAWQVTGLVR